MPTPDISKEQLKCPYCYRIQPAWEGYDDQDCFYCGEEFFIEQKCVIEFKTRKNSKNPNC